MAQSERDRCPLLTEEERRTAVTEEPTTSIEIGRLTTRRTVESRPRWGELARRVAILIFGLIQIVIALRFVLPLLNAREANAIVKGILDLSRVFVAPFEGILRTRVAPASPLSPTPSSQFRWAPDPSFQHLP